MFLVFSGVPSLIVGIDKKFVWLAPFIKKYGGPSRLLVLLLLLTDGLSADDSVSLRLVLDLLY